MEISTSTQLRLCGCGIASCGFGVLLLENLLGFRDDFIAVEVKEVHFLLDLLVMVTKSPDSGVSFV